MEGFPGGSVVKNLPASAGDQAPVLGQEHTGGAPGHATMQKELFPPRGFSP